MARLRQQLVSFVLPLAAAVIIPWYTWLGSRDAWHGAARVLGVAAAVPVGVVGLWLFVSSVRLFVRVGQGTLAPWSPTQKLVVRGIYRRTRNPMISGVLMIIVAEGLILASPGVLWWAAIFFGVSTVYFKVSEEPGLVARFGGDYEEYRRHVPMWLPRLKPWESTPR